MYKAYRCDRDLYDSNEASQDDVEGILVEGWRIWLGGRGRVVRYV